MMNLEDQPQPNESPAPVPQTDTTKQASNTIVPNSTNTATRPQPVAVEKVTVSPTDTPVHAGNNSPLVLIVEWLTYAFWGWLILAIGGLVALVVAYVLDTPSSDDTDVIAYGIAGAIVLLVISLTCDILFSRRESIHKHGPASVIMIIHAVIYALFGIGALIVAVFSIVSMIINTGSHTGAKIALATSIVMFILYVLTLARAIRPMISPKFRLIYRIAMVVAVAGITIWGIVGPAASALATKNDRAIQESVQTLSSAISEYVDENNELPTDIDSALEKYENSYNSESVETAKSLLSDGKITYKPNTKAERIEVNEYSTEKTTYYQLCGKYTHGLDNRTSNYYYGNSSGSRDDGYSMYIRDYPTEPGEFCHKLMTDFFVDTLDDYPTKPLDSGVRIIQ